MEKQEKKQKKILTENRKTTIDKRECSFEGLMEKFPKGEDAVYHLISKDNTKDIFKPKISITEDDIKNIPFIAQMREAIQWWRERLLLCETGRERYIAKEAIIELQKEQYIIKQAYKKPVNLQSKFRNSNFHLPINDKSIMRFQNGERKVEVRGISLMSPNVITAILQNYSKLKEDTYDCFESDIWYLLQIFDEISERALSNYPIYYAVVEMKIDKKSNEEIAQFIKDNYNKEYTPEYISTIWCKRVPKLIAKVAKEDYTIWYYNKYKLPVKKCNRCGQNKPRTTAFFSRNGDSRDGLYSICKECRKKKRK